MEKTCEPVESGFRAKQMESMEEFGNLEKELVSNDEKKLLVCIYNMNYFSYVQYHFSTFFTFLNIL